MSVPTTKYDIWWLNAEIWRSVAEECPEEFVAQTICFDQVLGIYFVETKTYLGGERKMTLAAVIDPDRLGRPTVKSLVCSIKRELERLVDLRRRNSR